MLIHNLAGKGDRNVVRDRPGAIFVLSSRRTALRANDARNSLIDGVK